MLVGALDVEVGPHALAVALLDHISVGRAAIEPDVEDVGDRLVIGEVVVVAEQGLVVGGEPGIGAALAEGLDDAGIHRLVAQIIAGLAMDIERNRHPPGALAGSEEHTSGLQSLMRSSYAGSFLKK